MTTLEGLWTYGYDAIGELTSVQLPNGRLIQYQYDANGNRISVTDNGTTTNYTTNNLNQYVTVGNVTYGYDADGNMISKQDASGLTTYTYDDQNRLINVAGPDGTWTYTYDVFGNMRATTHNGQRTDYLLDPSEFGVMVSEYNGAGGLVADYTYGLGLTSQVGPTGVANYYDFDVDGSTVGLTGTNGSYLNTYSYLPFGENAARNVTVANPFTYVGQFGVMEEGNGLDAMRARYYGPEAGRFSSTDPLGIALPNLYTYAANNPLEFIDPLGLWYIDIGISGGFILGGTAGIQFNSSGLWVYGGVGATTPGIGIGVTGTTANPSTGGSIQVQGAYGPGVVGIAGSVSKSFNGFLNPTQGWTGQGGFGVGLGGSKVTGVGAYIVGTLQLFGEPPAPPTGTPGGDGSSSNSHSMDPNDKIGPSGFGSANFVSLNQAFPYRIDFENDATATAPAQRVDVTDQLSASLDWNTFQITEIGFGDTVLTVPAGTQHYQTTVSMTYSGVTFDVQIEVGIHADTGLVYATFQSIDPNTSLPPDILIGFLPPEDGTGRGMGHISFTVRPMANLATGTQIRNVALVTFDLGETIATDQVNDHDPTQGTDPAKEALVTIDALPPTSSVQALPGDSPPCFVVRWSGADDPGGSGIAYFDIYLSDNGGPFTLWLHHTTQNAAAFTGAAGHSYGFYSVATDNVGNQEAMPMDAQATTTVDQPDSATHFSVVLSSATITAGTPFTITVTVLDPCNIVFTGYTGTVHFSSSDGNALLPPDYTFTADDAGVHTFTVTLNTPGNQTAVVTDTLNPAVSGVSVAITEFAVSAPADGPAGITVGPDGNLWFTENTGNKIGRINPDGTVTEFAIPTPGSDARVLVAGPDGNLWFTEFRGNRIGRIGTDGAITEFALPTANSGPLGMVVGPDGNLWFAEGYGNRIGRIGPDGTITEFAVPTANSGPVGITVGPDGNLWFTESDANQVGMITPDGSNIVEFALPTANSGPEGITTGPDGNLWFTETNANQIGRISPDGSAIAEFPIGTLLSGPQWIVVGPDGNLWFTELYGNQIGRITPDGSSLVEFLVPTPGAVPAGITVGPDNNIWFTENGRGQVGQLSAQVLVTSNATGSARKHPATGASQPEGFGSANGLRGGMLTPAPAMEIGAMADPVERAGDSGAVILDASNGNGAGTQAPGRRDDTGMIPVGGGVALVRLRDLSRTATEAISGSTGGGTAIVMPAATVVGFGLGEGAAPDALLSSPVEAAAAGNSDRPVEAEGPGNVRGGQEELPLRTLTYGMATVLDQLFEDGPELLGLAADHLLWPDWREPGWRD